MQRPTKTIVKALKKKGFVPEGGDHKFYFFNYNGLTESIFTKVSHGSGYREVYNDRLKEMGVQLKLSLKEFLSLVDCDLDENGYAALLRERGFIRE